MLENGIALLAVLGTYGIPLIVELGVFLDVLMGFLVMQIFVYQIHETFESIDVEQLNRLRHDGPGAVPFVAAARPAAARGRCSRRRAAAWPRLRELGCTPCSRWSPVAAAVWLAALVVAGAVPDLGADRAVPGGRAVRAAGASAWRRVGARGAASGRAGRRRRLRRRAARRFRIFASLFAFTMLVAVTIDNVAVMWVAIEATTITSAVLVPLHRSRGLGRGVVEVHPDRLGRHRAGLRGHGARLLRLRHAGGRERGGAQLDGAHGRRARACTRR